MLVIIVIVVIAKSDDIISADHVIRVDAVKVAEV